MNYLNNKNYIFGSIVLGLALVFIVGLSGASTANACYSGDCDAYYPPVYYPPVQTQTSPLQVNCYPQPLTVNAGDSATWVSNVFGGTGSYSYSWSGTDGLYGAGSSLSKIYYTSGPKSANLTVTSGNQTKSVSCSGSVTVYGNSTYTPPVYNPPVYYPPTTYYPPTYYQPIQISCSPNTTYTALNSPVTWTASVYYGGTSYNNYYGYNNGYATYSWTGTDGIYGYGQSISTTYNTPGYKTASVTVTVNGQTSTATCGSSVNVYGYAYGSMYYTQPVYNQTVVTQQVSSNNNGLNIGCYSDPSTASLNQPITWSVEVTGGVGPYTYSWSGTDGLSGKSDTVIKYYNSYGEKNAVVSVSSADGKTGTRACSNTVNVKRPVSSGTTVTTPAKTTTKPAVIAPSNTNDTGQSAAALFSLENVPWGWVAILIILVLIATVFYLIFNRPKI
jgi:hypothetical protein